MIAKKKSAFTLIEVLVVIALTSILTGTMLVIYQNNNESYNVLGVKTDLYRHNLIALDTIRTDIKKANGLLTSYDIYSAGTGTIILKIPQLDNDKRPVDNSYYYVIYRPDPNDSRNLERIEIVDSLTTSRIINKNLSSITFTPKDNLGNLITNNIENTAQVTIDLILSDDYRGRNFPSKLTSTETMRNK